MTFDAKAAPLPPRPDRLAWRWTRGKKGVCGERNVPLLLVRLLSARAGGSGRDTMEHAAVGSGSGRRLRHGGILRVCVNLPADVVLAMGVVAGGAGGCERLLQPALFGGSLRK